MAREKKEKQSEMDNFNPDICLQNRIDEVNYSSGLYNLKKRMPECMQCKYYMVWGYSRNLCTRIIDQERIEKHMAMTTPLYDKQRKENWDG